MQGKTCAKNMYKTINLHIMEYNFVFQLSDIFGTHNEAMYGSYSPVALAFNLQQIAMLQISILLLSIAYADSPQKNSPKLYQAFLPYKGLVNFLWAKNGQNRLKPYFFEENLIYLDT